MGGRSIAKRLPDSIQDSTPYIREPHRVSIVLGESRKTKGSEQGSPGNATERRHRTGGTSRLRVLQQTLSGKEGIRELASSIRRVQVKQICEENQILHGNHPVCAISHPGARLDDFHGHERCLLSYSYPSQLKEVSQICFRGEDLPVQSPAFWPEHSPSSIYQGASPCGKDNPSFRDENHPIPGRLASAGQVERRNEEGKRIYSQTSSGDGDNDQLREVESGSNTENRVLGNGDRFKEFLGFPFEETHHKLDKNSKRIYLLKRTASETVASVTRTHVIHREIRPRSQATNETFAVCSKASMGQEVTIEQDPSGSTSLSSERSDLVGRCLQVEQGNIPQPTEPRPSVVVRRIQRGMGSNNREKCIFGEMVEKRNSSSYKQFGTKGSVERTESGGVLSMQQEDSSVFRQHHSSILSTETGRDEVLGSVCISKRDVNMGRNKKHRNHSPVYQRSQECNSGLPKQEGSSYSHGVDPSFRCVQAAVEDMGPTNSRSVCDQAQQQTTNLHVSSPRRTGSSHGRHVAVMVQHGRLCFPPFRHNSESPQQTQDVAELQNDTSGSMVASAGVVPGSSEAASGCAKNSATQTRPPETTNRKATPSKPPHSSVNRLETVLRFGRAKKLSEEVSRYIFKARRPTTNQLYQLRWAVYYRWCKENKYSASRPTVNSICEFLIFLKRKKKLATGTIRGFKSMLHTVLRHVDFDIRNNQDIADVIRSFQVQDPVESRDTVSWNLDVVLRYLCSDKFEPLARSNLLDLTKKTLFLVTLALAKRVSEIQALSKDVGFSAQGATLSLSLAFRAKNDTKCKRLPRNFLIKDLAGLVGQEEEAKLCPVRALKEYLSRTKSVRGPENKRLFVSPRCPSRPASKNGLSFLMKALIREAHEKLQPEMLPILKASIHEVRGVATSVSFQKNMSLDSVMEAAQWRCQSVFASHYLKDISIDYGTCRTLGPFVAAGTVVP